MDERRRRRFSFGTGSFVGGIAPPPPSGWVNEYSVVFDGVNKVMTGSYRMTGSGLETGLPINTTSSVSFSFWMWLSGNETDNQVPAAGNKTYWGVGNQGSAVADRQLILAFKKRDAISQLEWTQASNDVAQSGFTNNCWYSMPSGNMWNHYVAVLNPFETLAVNKIQLFINGQRITQAATAGIYRNSLPTSSNWAFSIGAQSAGRYADCAIDEFAVYNIALTGTEATILYNGGTPIDPLSTTGSDAVVHYWRFGDAGDAYPNIYDQIRTYPGVTPMDFTMVNAEAGDITASVPPLGTITW